MRIRTAVLAAALALAAGQAMAANARNPYGNIDPRWDRGNDTGDSRVEELNRQQLDQNYWRNNPPPPGYVPPGYGYAPPPPRPYYPPPPPPGYYPPPYPYYR